MLPVKTIYTALETTYTFGTFVYGFFRPDPLEQLHKDLRDIKKELEEQSHHNEIVIIQLNEQL